MKKKLSPHYLRLFISIFIAGIFTTTLKAQFVSIPDTAFATWLQTNGFADCMDGNQLDTSSPMLTGVRSLCCHSVFIKNMAGIQYFKNLDSLDFSYSSVSTLTCLPARLSYLNCQHNYILNLPVLPASLSTLLCNYNQLSALPALPASLQMLDCSNNQLVSLPVLPTGLTGLCCYYNQLNNLPALPQTLLSLACDNNHLVTLPQLPPALQYLSCGFNQINSIPGLPAGLIELYAVYNKISSLPELPAQLKFLYVYYNQLATLPALPGTITVLDCSANQLIDLPALPDSLNFLNCSYNHNLTCLPPVKTILYLYFDSTSVSCVPDYGNVVNSSPDIKALPLCGSASATCPSATGLTSVPREPEWTFNLYPNPAKDYAIIEPGTNAIGGQILVTDMEGREIFKSIFTGMQTRIPVAAFPAGLYYVKLSAPVDNEGRGHSAVKKLVVE